MGFYQKDEGSDINSIVTGMIGFKGHVHVSFGQEVSLTSDDADDAARQIDKQIIQNYLLQPTNFLALQKLRDSDPQRVPAIDLPADLVVPMNAESAAKFEERLDAADPVIRPYLLQAYANPVISRYAAGKSDPFAEQVGAAETTED